MRKTQKSLTGAFITGLLCVFGFAPFGLYLIPVFALFLLFTLWYHADKPSDAAWLGFVFGLGLFVSGIGWIYIALHDYGAMPVLLALPATLLFAAFLALFPALAGYAQARFPVSGPIRMAAVMPVAWMLIEWLRGTIFTGFPWLTFGYAQNESPLAGYAPILGVYGVSLSGAASAGLLAILLCGYRDKKTRWVLAIFIMIWVGGGLLRNVMWAQPYGAPLSVTLVQGNLAQDIKFDKNVLADTLETYRNLTLQNPARLTILPETALPLFRHEVPEPLIEELRNHARKNNGDILIGSFERNNGQYYNSVFTLGMADEQHYRKQHLVIFGEFIPLRPLFGWLINEVLDIPMGDLARGDPVQAALNVSGQRVAANICYEDVFGEEIIRALPNATLLVNFTNDAWYGDSHAASQHNQISQMRALESGRMMLRATNTGVTSIIGANGKTLHSLPQHRQAVLSGMAQGYEGSTPYVRWGNAAAMMLAASMLLLAWMRRKMPCGDPEKICR